MEKDAKECCGALNAGSKKRAKPLCKLGAPVYRSCQSRPTQQVRSCLEELSLPRSALRQAQRLEASGGHSIAMAFSSGFAASFFGTEI